MSELKKTQMVDLTIEPVLTEKKEVNQEKFKLTAKGAITFVIYMIISSYAAYLSISCSKDSHMIMRGIYAFFAFTGGIFYLIAYALFKKGLCTPRYLNNSV